MGNAKPQRPLPINPPKLEKRPQVQPKVNPPKPDEKPIEKPKVDPILDQKPEQVVIPTPPESIAIFKDNIKDIQQRFQKKFNLPPLDAEEQTGCLNFFNALSYEEFKLVAPDHIKSRYDELQANEIIKLNDQEKEIRQKIIQIFIDKVEKNPQVLNETSLSQLFFIASYYQLNHSIMEKIPLDMLPDLFLEIKKQLESKEIDLKNYEQFWIEFFEKCEDIKRFVHIMYCFFNEKKVLKDFALMTLYKKDKINEFAQSADIFLIKEYLNHCDDHKIYFALKESLIKENRYDSVFVILDDLPKKRMEVVAKNGFQFPPTPLDIKFHTQITDKEGNLIHVTMYDTHELVGNSHRYELKNENNEKIGWLYLETQEGYLLIHSIETPLEKEGEQVHNNIDEALLEFALRESFKRNLQGHVRIKDPADKDDFLFLYGYRYVDHLEPNYGAIDKEFLKAIEDYFEAKNNQKPIDEIIAQIEQFEKKEDLYFTIKPNFKLIYQAAKNALKRDPKDMKEILDYGVYIDKNGYLEEAIASDPFRHQALGSLIKEYKQLKENEHKVNLAEEEEVKQHFEKKRQILQQFKDLKEIPRLNEEENKQLQKIFKHLEKNAISKIMHRPDIEEILQYGKYQNFGGPMALIDEAINHWKQRLAIA